MIPLVHCAGTARFSGTHRFTLCVKAAPKGQVRETYHVPTCLECITLAETYPFPLFAVVLPP